MKQLVAFNFSENRLQLFRRRRHSTIPELAFCMVELTGKFLSEQDGAHGKPLCPFHMVDDPRRDGGLKLTMLVNVYFRFCRMNGYLGMRSPPAQPASNPIPRYSFFEIVMLM
jgi:hypothetical protein